MQKLTIIMVIPLLMVFLVLVMSGGDLRMLGKGYMGELLVSTKLQWLGAEQYKVINNLMLPSSGNTKYTQIDHILVSNFGIFCIETKSHKGWIFGSANQRYWTQVLYKYRGRIYNPLYQNYAHVKAVETALTSTPFKKHIIPFVVFTDADKLNITGSDSVGFVTDIFEKIQNFKNVMYSDQERDSIYEALVNANVQGSEATYLHLNQVSTIVDENAVRYKANRYRPAPISL